MIRPCHWPPPIWTSIPSNDERSVNQVTVIVANLNPNDPTDTGQVTLGYYVLDGDRLTMTDGEGMPFHGKVSGDRVMQRGSHRNRQTIDDADLRVVRGDGTDFNRRLVYGPVSFA
jgi:hypothetical protein